MSQSGKILDIKQVDTEQEKPEYQHTGQYLQKLRAEKGLTIKEVANTTRISEVNLIAIENQDFEALPADTFTRGFLSIYARLLGIDPKETVHSFMQERENKKAGGKRVRTKKTVNVLTPKTMAEPSHFSSLTGAVILLIIIALVFTAFCIYTSWNPFSFLTAKENTLESIMMSVVPESQFHYQQNYGDTLEEEAEQPYQDENNEQKQPTDPTLKDQSKSNSPVAEHAARYSSIPLFSQAASAETPDPVLADYSFFADQHRPATPEPVFNLTENYPELTLNE